MGDAKRHYAVYRHYRRQLTEAEERVRNAPAFEIETLACAMVIYDTALGRLALSEARLLAYPSVKIEPYVAPEYIERARKSLPTFTPLETARRAFKLSYYGRVCSRYQKSIRQLEAQLAQQKWHWWMWLDNNVRTKHQILVLEFEEAKHQTRKTVEYKNLLALVGTEEKIFT